MARGLSSVQLTLAILKPDLMMNRVRTKAVKEVISRNCFNVLNSKVVHWSREEAEMFYQEHRDRFFFNRLVGYMSSGPLSPLILARTDAIKHWRQLMGPTKVFQARQSAPSSIRALYGLSDTRNATHGSGGSSCQSNTSPAYDSEESARREIGFFFPEFDHDAWLQDHFCQDSGVVNAPQSA